LRKQNSGPPSTRDTPGRQPATTVRSRERDRRISSGRPRRRISTSSTSGEYRCSEIQTQNWGEGTKRVKRSCISRSQNIKRLLQRSPPRCLVWRKRDARTGVLTSGLHPQGEGQLSFLTHEDPKGNNVSKRIFTPGWGHVLIFWGESNRGGFRPHGGSIGRVKAAGGTYRLIIRGVQVRVGRSRSAGSRLRSLRIGRVPE